MPNRLDKVNTQHVQMRKNVLEAISCRVDEAHNQAENEYHEGVCQGNSKNDQHLTVKQVGPRQAVNHMLAESVVRILVPDQKDHHNGQEDVELGCKIGERIPNIRKEV